MTHIDRLQGKLLLVHGMLDENVHFRHTTRLINALVKANKPYDLLLYPDERHMPRSEKDRIAMETRILEYFRRHL
jgi:dipeptidyl-peptidase-4